MGNISGLEGWNRIEAAGLLDDFSRSGKSFREFSRQAGVPRTTLQHWRNRAKRIDLPEATVRFFESHAGQEFIHRFYTALILDLHERGNCSLRSISSFLQKTGLDRFIPASKSNLAKSSAAMEDVVIGFSLRERERMAAEMPEKRISVAQDETFPSGICLVAVEPVSNFILLERMADNRKTETWDAGMKQALGDLPVTVIQGVGDESRSLVKHVTEGLSAHHSPDTFHIQQELTRGASAQLHLRIKRETEVLEERKKETAAWEKRQTEHANLEFKPKGRPVAFADHIAEARQREIEQAEKLREAMNTEKTFHSARREISDCYHPYSLENGLAQSPRVVETRLKAAFDRIQKVTDTLAEVFKKKILKARRQINAMRATIVFYFSMVELYLDNQHFDDRVRMLLEDILIPACYLKQAASKIQDKAKRHEVESAGNALRDDFDRSIGPFEMYQEHEKQNMLKAAEECVAFFQRSSSAVEGRNGQLALKYHNLHRLSGRKLKCLTALHNFDTRRPDGTTPAQRFFEAKHPDLFEHLLETLKPPGRPRVSARLAMAA
jgi:hypothetical protein